MRQRILIISAIAAVALVTATAALAGTLTATATVSGTAGVSLNLPSNPSVSDTLDGTDQTVSYAPVLGVVDARGSGAGWNLQISATTFSDGAGHTLAPGTVSAAAQACHSGSSCTAATNSGITLAADDLRHRGEVLQRGSQHRPRQARRHPDGPGRDSRQHLRRHVHLDGHARSGDRPLGLHP